jgi:hypothetical protein
MTFFLNVSDIGSAAHIASEFGNVSNIGNDQD